VTTFGFLHTADVHVGSFTRLLDEISPDDRAVHVVDPSLLTDARRRGGVDDDLRVRMGGRVRELSARGAVRVVCTCSTIGGPAEEIGRQIGVPVRRVDRPMARVAVAAGDDIAVVAALEATIEPTHRLLRETADAVGRPVRIVDAPCPAAWSHFEAGDGDRYLATLAAHLESLDDRSDVIVLAQASMAPVEALVRVTALVLSSPRPAVMDLVHRS
jgi:hypothetical protein